MTRRRRNKLSPEDRALWDKVTQSAIPLAPTARRLKLPEALGHVPTPALPEPPSRIAKFSVGEAAHSKPYRHDLHAEPFDRMLATPVHMDKKSFGRMKRGRMVPEARLDLHGKTLDVAHPALNRFILKSQADGKRLVLVITGKGKDRADNGPIPLRRGLLRHQVPQWLRLPPLAGLVLQVARAHQSHGGAGALYVYLRRNR